MTNKMTIRERVMEAVSEHASQACINQHTRNIHTLYAAPGGRVYWGEEVSTNTWDVIPGTVDRMATVYQTGTGSCACNCDACTAGDDPEAWAANDAGDLVDELIRAVDQIPYGYFKDESTPQLPTPQPLFVSIKTAVMRGSEHIAEARSKTMAKRIANALNKHAPNSEGV